MTENRLVNDPSQARFRQACADLDRRLRAGESAAAEDWVAAGGSLADDEDLAVELIFTEYVTREELGQAPDHGEYYRRFPAHEGRLRRLFGVDRLFHDSADRRAETPRPFDDRTPSLGPPGRLTAPERVGPYEIRGTIGAGGMGVVYRGWHPTLKRDVAVKVLRSGDFATPAEIARLKTEAEAVARQNHPNVVQIFDVGEADGRPYLVLEYVPGPNLREHLGDRTLPSREAAELVATLARAVHHAHERGVVHRDLKPANVLLAPETLAPKITDFGLAAMTDLRATATTTGQLIGTAAYMPPEQAEGRPGWVTPAVDVYSLGAILYELITGRPPLVADTPLETLRRVLADDPVPPRQLVPSLPKDLETIALKCLQKAPARRYASAADLADDLERFLAGRAIRARPATATERAIHWAKRRPTTAAAVGVALLGALVAFAIGAAYTVRLREERNAKEFQRSETHLQKAEAEKQKAEAEIQKAEAVTERLRAESHHAATRDLWYASQVQRAAALARSDPLQSNAVLNQTDVCPADRREFAWKYLDALTRPALFDLPHARPSGVAAGGKHIVSVGASGDLRVWDSATGAPLAAIPNAHAKGVLSLAVTSDGTKAVTGGADGKVLLWDLPKGELRGTIAALTAPAFCVAISADGKRVAAGGATIAVWEAETGTKLLELPRPGSLPRGVAFSPDGTRLAVGYAVAQLECEVVLWNVAEKKPAFVQRFPNGLVPALAFSRDGKALAVGGLSRSGSILQPTLKLLAAADGAVLATMPSANGTWAVAFSADDKQLAAAHHRGGVSLWDVRTGDRVASLPGHPIAARPSNRLALYTSRIVPADEPTTAAAIAFTPDGRLVSGGNDDKLRVWAIDPDRFRRTLPAGGPPVSAILPLGKTVLVGTSDGQLRRWNPASGEVVPLGESLGGRIAELALSPDGRTVAVAAGESVRLRDLATGRDLHVLAHGGSVAHLAFAPDGAIYAVGSDRLNGWEPVGGKATLAVVLAAKAKTVHALGVSAKSIRLIQREATLIWDRATGEALPSEAASVPIDGAAIGTDGAVATLSYDKTARAYLGTISSADGSVRRLEPPPVGFLTPAFSPDGRTLAALSSGTKLRLWHVATGQALAEVDYGSGGPASYRFAADGTGLAVMTRGPGTSPVRVHYWFVGSR